MPRNLPWLQKGGSSTTMNRPKKPANTRQQPTKRSRSEGTESDDSTTPNKERAQNLERAHSTSPPPEPPSERFMDEGMEHDDKYRMVEDEFLSVAQKWTVHLHAAEYKRQEKIAKTRNADTITLISRPVTERMPDQTRRKVEGVARSKAQRSALEGLLEKKAAADDTDDSDDDGLPYVGTTLHGLMDSPRRKAASLSRLGSGKRATRAAAGFQKPSQSRTYPGQRMASDSPVSKNNNQSSLLPKNQSDISTASSNEDDDDLDAPIPAPKLEPIAGVVRATTQSTYGLPVPSSSTIRTFRSIQRSDSAQSKVSAAHFEREPSRSGVTDFEPPRAGSDAAERVARRREQVLKAKAKQEKEEQKKKKLDVIPTFL